MADSVLIAVPRRERERPDTARRVVTGTRDRDIVRFLLRFGAATSGQVRAAFGLSVNGGNRVLRRLFDARLARRHGAMLTGSVSWHTQPVYTIGPQAALWAADWDGVSLDEARKRCQGDRTPTYLAHALSVVDLYLALKGGLDSQTGWTLRRFLVERECLDEMTVGSGKCTKRVVVRPDAVAVLRRASDGALLCFSLESDRHNVRTRAFAHKAAAYRLYAESGAFADAYPGARCLRVLTVTGGDARIRTLAAAAHSAGAASLFRFATRPALETHGFFGPVWHTETGTKEPLLSGLAAEGETT